MPNFLSVFKNAKHWFPQGSSRAIKRLYFAGFGLVTFIAPVLIIYGLWIIGEAARDRIQIQSLLGNRAESTALNVELMLDQQLSKLEAAAFFFGKTPMTDTELASEVRLAGEAIQTVVYMGVANADGTVSADSFPQFNNVLPFDIAAAVRQVAETGAATVQSRSVFIEDPKVTDAGIMLYAPMTTALGEQRVIIGAIPYKYVQDLLENYGPMDGVQAQNVVDNHYRLVARTSGIDEYFGAEASQKFKNATSNGVLQGAVETVSLDGAEILSVFKFSPSLKWWFNISIRQDYSAALLARSDNFVFVSAVIGLLLFVSIGVILTLNMMERQVAIQQLEDEKAFSDSMRKAWNERVLLLREVFHRVKNNLQVLKSLIRLSTKDFPVEVRQSMEALSMRIDAIAEVHSMLYQSNNLSVLNFRDYVEKLVPLVARVYTKPSQDVRVILNAHPVAVSLEMAVPLGLATVELLSNAYKHGLVNKTQGMLSINLYREKDPVTDSDYGVLEIEDNGEGFPIDFENKRSLGTKLIEKLALQLDGDVTWPASNHSNIRLRFALCNKTEQRAAEGAGLVTERHPVK